VFGHVKPGVHARQFDTATLPVVFRNVPEGHRVGAALPDGQYEPCGQMAPVRLSVGVATDAFATQ
jgi:hypothetical protein